MKKSGDIQTVEAQIEFHEHHYIRLKRRQKVVKRAGYPDDGAYGVGIPVDDRFRMQELMEVQDCWCNEHRFCWVRKLRLLTNGSVRFSVSKGRK